MTQDRLRWQVQVDDWSHVTQDILHWQVCEDADWGPVTQERLHWQVYVDDWRHVTRRNYWQTLVNALMSLRVS